MNNFVKPIATASSFALALVSLAGVAHAAPAPAQSAVPASSAGAPFTYTASGVLNMLSNVTNGTNTTSTASTFVNVPGMVTLLKVPPGKRAYLVARFSAESACAGNTGHWCSVRILVDGHEIAPATGFDFAFDTVNAGAPNSFMWRGASMDRSYFASSGTHTIVVQEATTDSSHGTTFWLGERSLTVESALL